MNLTNATEAITKKFQLYNILSCQGFETSEGMGLTFGLCAKAKLLGVVLFFINAFVRKWIGEEMGMDYSFWGGFGGALLAYIIVVSLTGNIIISFIVGLVGMAIGGFFGGQIFGGGDE